MTTHNHYFRTVPDGVTRIDVYRLLDMFDVTCPVAQHVIKKALVAGQRGHKTAHRDWQDIADSAGRKLEMIQEDDGWNKESVEAAALYTEATEARMDVVGQNGNTAEHYDQAPDWSQAPEGATHWGAETDDMYGAWYKKEGDEWMFWVSPHGSGWVQTDHHGAIIPRPE